jgi:hypothetical protein
MHLTTAPQKGTQQFNKNGASKIYGKNKSKQERAKKNKRKNTHHYA